MSETPHLRWEGTADVTRFHNEVDLTDMRYFIDDKPVTLEHLYRRRRTL